jgi:hypothetical protein
MRRLRLIAVSVGEVTRSVYENGCVRSGGWDQGLPQISQIRRITCKRDWAYVEWVSDFVDPRGFSVCRRLRLTADA